MRLQALRRRTGQELNWAVRNYFAPLIWTHGHEKSGRAVASAPPSERSGDAGGPVTIGTDIWGRPLLAAVSMACVVIGIVLGRVSDPSKFSTDARARLQRIADDAPALEHQLILARQSLTELGSQRVTLPDQFVPDRAEVAMFESLYRAEAIAARVGQDAAAWPSNPVPSPDHAEDPCWVYLGWRRSGKWGRNYFALDEVPASGVRITAKRDVYRRADFPEQDQTTAGWSKGRVVGVLRSGESATVRRVRKFTHDDGTEFLWAEVAVSPVGAAGLGR